MAQKSFDYNYEWKKVEVAMGNDLPKSAMEMVDKIYAQSKKDGSEAQQIKALVYRCQLVQQVQENDWYKNVKAFEEEISTAKEPVQQNLHSLAADLYYHYFQNKR